MAKRKKESVPIRNVTPAEADANLRRHDEYDAIHRRLPEMLELYEESARYTLAEEATKAPHNFQQDIIGAANCVLRFSKQLQEHMARGEIGQAVLAGIEVGLMSERRVRFCFTPGVIHLNQSKLGAEKASNTRTKTANKDYRRINAAVEEAIKRRGKRRQPSLTAIRHRVADELEFTYSKVLDAQRGGRKK